MEDLGEDSNDWDTCEMCESARIRYVHTMGHPDYPDYLNCGCVCAGNMESDYEQAKKRERRFVDKRRRHAQRLALWRQSGTWHRSSRGNYYRRERGFVVTLFRAQNGWGICLVNEECGYKRFSPSYYKTFGYAAEIALRAYNRAMETIKAVAP